MLRRCVRLARALGDPHVLGECVRAFFFRERGTHLSPHVIEYATSTLVASLLHRAVTARGLAASALHAYAQSDVCIKDLAYEDVYAPLVELVALLGNATAA